MQMQVLLKAKHLLQVGQQLLLLQLPVSFLFWQTLPYVRVPTVVPGQGPVIRLVQLPFQLGVRGQCMYVSIVGHCLEAL